VTVGVTFSGDQRDDPRLLDATLKAATSVRITPRGCLVYAVDPDADVLDPATEKWVKLMSTDIVAHVGDPEAVAELRRLLAVEEFLDFVCMCPGDLALEFLDAKGERLTVLRFDKPGWIDWPMWQGNARLQDVDGLVRWFLAHGVDRSLVTDT
jgi:hypothetical protein